MKITTFVCLAVGAGALAGEPALADPVARNHGVNKRQQTQQERVRKGVQSGELTRKHDGQDRDAAPASGPHDPAVNARQDNQTDRIVQGVASGQLTRKEATELVEERRDIKQLERDYKSDGTLTEQERRDLHQQLDQAGEEIREEKHDAQQR